MPLHGAMLWRAVPRRAPSLAVLRLRRALLRTGRCGGTAMRACGAAVSPPPPPPPSSTFRSATNFTLSPAQVNETNVPSAREVGAMIPTLRELQAQLPAARELEERYIHPEAAVAPAAPAATIFQPTTDPLEDLLFGPPKEEAATDAATDTGRPGRQQLLLAYRALFWGTAYALLGFGATVAAAMYLCGYHSLGALMDGVRGKLRREEDRLRASAGGPAGAVTEHYVIDLTQPTEAWRQVQEVWAAVQRVAEEEEAAAAAKAPPRTPPTPSSSRV